MKQVEFTILGGESQLQAAVATVDREMSAIRDAGKVKARERIAVLAALNLAYQLASRPPPAEAAAGRTAAAAAVDDERALDALIQRVDGALGNDGQLL